MPELHLQNSRCQQFSNKDSALTAVENKIPSVSSLNKKTNYDTKISELEKKLTDHNHDKYITASKFNTSAADVFNARFQHKQI